MIGREAVEVEGTAVIGVSLGSGLGSAMTVGGTKE
jgi:hypothetical protein